MLILLLFLTGLFFGSFFLVVIDRFESKDSFLKGRSKCDSCKKTLRPVDLIPVLSFISTRGKCRYCGVRLSLMYSVVELLTGLLFGFVAYWIGSQYLVFSILHLANLIFYLYIISSLLLIFFIDLKYGIIPFSIIFPAIIITFIFQAITTNSLLPYTILSALGASFFFFLLFAFTKGRGMGFGDVVYAFFMGLLLGYPNIIVGLYISFLVGAAISLILIGLHKKKLRGSTVPFGPFLVFGTIASLFYGEQITSLALRFLIQM